MKNTDADICISNNCVTVHGETAVLVNRIAIIIAIMFAISAFVVMIKRLQ
jgi:hypothetical protein